MVVAVTGEVAEVTATVTVPASTSATLMMTTATITKNATTGITAAFAETNVRS